MESESPLRHLGEILELHSDVSPEDRQAILDLPHRTRVFESASYSCPMGSERNAR